MGSWKFLSIRIRHQIWNFCFEKMFGKNNWLWVVEASCCCCRVFVLTCFSNHKLKFILPQICRDKKPRSFFTWWSPNVGFKLCSLFFACRCPSIYNSGQCWNRKQKNLKTSFYKYQVQNGSYVVAIGLIAYALLTW